MFSRVAMLYGLLIILKPSFRDFLIMLFDPVTQTFQQFLAGTWEKLTPLPSKPKACTNVCMVQTRACTCLYMKTHMTPWATTTTHSPTGKALRVLEGSNDKPRHRQAPQPLQAYQFIQILGKGSKFRELIQSAYQIRIFAFFQAYFHDLDQNQF